MRSWSSVVTVSCLIIVAVVEAWQQALSGSPGVAAIMPRLSGAWNFVPLILLVIAGLSWIAGHIRKLSPAPSASLRPPQAPTPSSVAFGQPSPPIPLSHQGSASALDESSKMVIVQPKGRTLHCESIGITHASAAEDTKAWKAEGAIPAAVVVFRNPTKRTLRNVSGTATFYDSEGRSIARSLLPWLGELRDNTGFLPDQKRAMVVAVRREGSTGTFSTPEIAGRVHELGMDIVSVSVLFVSEDFVEHWNFTLKTRPYLEFSLTMEEV